MKRRTLLQSGPLLAGAAAVVTSAQAQDPTDRPFCPTPQNPLPADFDDAEELAQQWPLAPLLLKDDNASKRPADWDGTKEPRIGEGPCGIAKEFGPSGPVIGAGQVLEYLDDDDPAAGNTWLSALTNELQGARHPRLSCYKVDIKPGKVKIDSRPGTKETNILGYNGQWPGPLFAARVGDPMVIRFVNKTADYMSVHLHGGHGPAHSDGHPTFVIPKETEEDNSKAAGYWQNHRDYYYPHTVPAVGTDRKDLDWTESPSTMWYHDHSMDITGRMCKWGWLGFSQRSTSWN